MALFKQNVLQNKAGRHECGDSGAAAAGDEGGVGWERMERIVNKIHSTYMKLSINIVNKLLY